MATQAGVDSGSAVQSVRKFNRFYTHQIGALGEQHLQSPFSPTESRVLYELNRDDTLTATDLAKSLNLDLGYLSRILKKFEKDQLLVRKASTKDARQSVLKLTKKGKDAYAPLNELASTSIAQLLETLSPADKIELVQSMNKIENLLDKDKNREAPFILRTHQAGDMGWIVHRHGVLYSKEYNYDERFEMLVAEVVAQFIRDFNPKRERCWLAERNGEILGSIFLVEESKTVAKIRLFLVEPSARGQGIGARLLQECIRFAQNIGYEKITLWTNAALKKARQLYEQNGFTLVKEEPHQMFGPPSVGQTFELTL